MADEDKKTTEEVKAEEAPKKEVTPEADTATEADKKEEAPAEEAEEGKADEPEAEEAPSVEETSTEEAAEEATPAEEIKIEEAQQKIETGMVVRVHVKIKDVTPRGDERERIQVFEGTVINKGGQDLQSATITVRKISGGVGVERIFPLMMPMIEKIEVVKQYRTRRSKLFFLRNKLKKKLKEIVSKK
jgi:large subunit ribosomal protein L19